MLAGPVLATLKLIFGYMAKKLVDQDPWEDLDAEEPKEPARWAVFIDSQWERFKTWLPVFLNKVGRWIKLKFGKVVNFVKSKLRSNPDKKTDRQRKRKKE